MDQKKLRAIANPNPLMVLKLVQVRMKNNNSNFDVNCNFDFIRREPCICLFYLENFAYYTICVSDFQINKIKTFRFYGSRQIERVSQHSYSLLYNLS